LRTAPPLATWELSGTGSAQDPVSNQPGQAAGGSSVNEVVPGSEHNQRLPVTQGNNPFSSPHPNLLPPYQQEANSGTPDPTLGHTASLPTGDDDEKTRLVAKPAVSSGALSALAGSGSGGSSPSKQSHRPPSPPTKTSPSATAPSNGPAPSLSAENTSSMTTYSAPMALPHLTPAQSHNARSDHAASGSSPLPPPSGGLSPTKHSPPVPRPQQQQVNGGANGAGTPLLGGAHPPSGVFQPVAALSPSPRQQILTPPVKPAEPVRIPPQQVPQGVQTPKLVPSSSPRLDAQSS
jgi:hypothetical protein